MVFMHQRELSGSMLTCTHFTILKSKGRTGEVPDDELRRQQSQESFL